MYLTNILNDIQRMQGQLSKARLNGTFEKTEHRCTDFPEVQIYANTDQLAVRMELPGLSQEEIDLNITDDVLSISGEIKRYPEDNMGKILRQERKMGKFQKLIELPYPVEGDEAQAVLKNGILTITLPIKETVKPRQVTIKSE